MIGFRRLGLRHLSVSHLNAVACCAARLGKPKEAAQLFGTYDVMHSKYLQQAGTPGRSNRFEKLTLIKEKLQEGHRDYLRQVLGNEDFEVIYTAGTRISFDEAVELVLSLAQETIVWCASDHPGSI